MIPTADSLAVQTVLERWLEQTATAEEEAQLWQWVSESRTCARELAAASRFHGMLAETIKARDIEDEARRQLALTPRSHETTRALPRVEVKAGLSSWRPFALAAAIALVGMLSVLYWPTSPPHPWVGQSPVSLRPSAPERTPVAPVRPVPALTTKGLAGQPHLKTSPMTLIEQLDGFFIGPLSIDALPLGQAMGLLRQLLEEKETEGRVRLTSLHITVPAGAMARRVSFHTQTPLPFLKAVRAIAALAGCDVQAAGETIAIILHPSIFPLAVEKKKITDLLVGRVGRDGTPLQQDPLRLQALMDDAAMLGIVPANDGTAMLSSGQWAALLQLMDSRDYLNNLPLPTFAVYNLPADQAPLTGAGVLSPEQAEDFIEDMTRIGRRPDQIIIPRADAADPTLPIVLIPDGTEIRIALNASPLPQDQPTTPLVANNSPRQISDPRTLPIDSTRAGIGPVSSQPPKPMTYAASSQGSGFVLSDPNATNTIQVIVTIPTTQPPP